MLITIQILSSISYCSLFLEISHTEIVCNVLDSWTSTHYVRKHRKNINPCLALKRNARVQMSLKLSKMSIILHFQYQNITKVHEDGNNMASCQSSNSNKYTSHTSIHSDIFWYMSKNRINSFGLFDHYCAMSNIIIKFQSKMGPQSRDLPSQNDNEWMVE